MPTVLFILFPVLHHLTLPVPLHSCCSINTNSYMLPSSKTAHLSVSPFRQEERQARSTIQQRGMLIAGEGCEACACVWRRPTAGKWRRAKGKGQTERERDTSCEDFFFFPSLSLSIAPPQHREDGKKKAKWKEGWRECCLCGKEIVLSEEYAYREGRWQQKAEEKGKLKRRVRGWGRRRDVRKLQEAPGKKQRKKWEMKLLFPNAVSFKF